MSVRPHPDVVAQRVEDELVLVNLRTNRIFSLNSPAARFWELLADGNDRDAIVRTMADEFAVGEDEVRGEVASLVESLAAEQLVAPRAGA